MQLQGDKNKQHQQISYKNKLSKAAVALNTIKANSDTTINISVKHRN